MHRIESRGLPERAGRPGLIWPVVGITACLAAAAVDALLVEPNTPVIERIDVPIWELPSALDGYRIAVLSDPHYPIWATRSLIRRAIALANSVEPDIIAVPGDIVDRRWFMGSEVPSLAGVFDEAVARDGIVGVLGNHDYRFDHRQVREEIARSTPIRLIENTSLCIERDGGRMAIGGVGDLWRGEVRPDRAFAGVPAATPRLLISHNPDLADQMPERIRVDLQVSGHTHGGQVCLPNGFAPHVPSRYGNRFRAGLVAGRRHRVYISRGIASTHGVRFCCRPEVTAITLRRSEDIRHAPWNMAEA
ncbi:MAG TPA: metallophosphoesterase [Chthonomonadaceae bacterium]|nr:metallophosphoesterase [Chthonomonadaceae bacterium]